MSSVKKSTVLSMFFHLENYKVCQDFGRIAWWRALMDRTALYQEILDTRSESESIPILQHECLIRLGWISSEEYLSTYLRFDHSENDKPEYGFYGPAVQDVYVFDFISISEQLHQMNPHFLSHIANLNEELAKYKQTILEEDIDQGEDVFWFDFLDELDIGFIDPDEPLMSIHNSHFARIDLNKTDTEILKDMKTWLVERRKKLSKSSKEASQTRFTQNQIEKLFKYNILAYIDLYLLLEIFYSQLSYEQIAYLLTQNKEDFYSDEDPGEKIRRNVHPLAMKLLKSHSSYTFVL